MLARASRLLLEQNEQSMFLTATVARFDPLTGRVVYANGAHPPALLLSPGASPRRALEPTGTLVGAIEDQQYEERELVLEADSRVLLYTDGVPEARRAGGEFFGADRLASAAARMRVNGAREMCRELVEEVERFQEGRLADDVTVLIFGARGAMRGSGSRVPGSG
jgi:sigma-B regulation protein RsbU (phosphoserine phosphatase)